MAAIGGGVGSGLAGFDALSGNTWQMAAARGAVGNAIAQGIGVAIGLQDKFSWAGVAAAGVGAAVGHQVGGALSAAGADVFAARLGASTANAIANAATRSLIDGSDFGDNVRAALPDVIGSTIGEMVAGKIEEEVRASVDRRQQKYLEEIEEWAAAQPSGRERYRFDVEDQTGKYTKIRPITVIPLDETSGFDPVRSLLKLLGIVGKGSPIGIMAMGHGDAGTVSEYLRIAELGDDVVLKRNLDESRDWKILQAGHWAGQAEQLADGVLLIHDPELVADALGRELPGNVLVPFGTTRGPQGEPPRKGFAATIGSQEEADIVAEGYAKGWDSDQINAALDYHRNKARLGRATTTQLRGTAGIAFSTTQLPVINGVWLRGTDGNAGLIPEQVAARLEGRTFDSWKNFREEFWKTVADTPELAIQFSPQNRDYMQNGLAPTAARTQHYGSEDSYIIHHRDPIQHTGGVYDMSNMLVVTPRYHQEVLNPSYHFGRPRRP